MKLLFSAGLAFFFLIPIPFAGSAPIFTDIQNSPYQASIQYLGEKGIIEGYSGGFFRPQTSLNRAEMMKMIAGATLGLTTVEI